VYVLLAVTLTCAVAAPVVAAEAPPAITIERPTDVPRGPAGPDTPFRRRPHGRPQRPQRAAAPPTRPAFTVIDSSVKPLPHAMIRIPGGPSWIGSNWADSMVGPRHRVDVPEFFIDTYEVTNAQWARFVDATGTDPPDYWMNDEQPPDFERLPVLNVSWYEANAYAGWAGLRLPTEFEWEKAARGPDGLIFPWGHLYDPDKANTFQTNRFSPAPVGSFPGGASAYGVHDMLGNALEWTSSPFSVYPGSRFLPQKVVPDLRILRGVSWKYEPRPLFDRYPAPASWHRWNEDRQPPGRKPTWDVIGFRCAKDAPKDI